MTLELPYQAWHLCSVVCDWLTWGGHLNDTEEFTLCADELPCQNNLCGCCTGRKCEDGVTLDECKIIIAFVLQKNAEGYTRLTPKQYWPGFYDPSFYSIDTKKVVDTIIKKITVETRKFAAFHC